MMKLCTDNCRRGFDELIKHILRWTQNSNGKTFKYRDQ